MLRCVRSIAWLALLSLCFERSTLVAQPKPNVVVVLVDDMGFSDIGCYGGEIPTPNIDALAAGGLRFTQFYNAGRCCPTRASLLTGLYSHQAGIGRMTEDIGRPAYRGFLNDRCATLGEVLQTAGYFTAHTGKWHVGHGDDARLPLQRGFDRFYGVAEGGGFYFKPSGGRTVRLGNDVVYSDAKPPPDGWYSTDAWTEYGLRFIDEARAARKPFFLYLAHNAPHFPLQALPADIAKFRGKYNEGWDRLRAQRHARQQKLGVFGTSWNLTLRDDGIGAWEELDAKRRGELDLQMALYAAVMDRLDRAIGTLVAGLKSRGVLDDTLLLFLSDNGASPEGGTYGRNEATGRPGDALSQVYAGRAWANANNTPFRQYKASSHEGGIATPFIAHWPARIAARGETRTQPAHVIDLMPTLVEVAGASYPAQFKQHELQPMEGRSLLRTFLESDRTEARRLFWEHQGNAAVRDGDWKLVRLGEKGPWELYDLAVDRTETKSRMLDQPGRAKELTKAWVEWAQRVGVEPFRGISKSGLPAGKGRGKKE